MLERAVRLGQRGAAAGDDARLEGGAGRRQRILDPKHALLELDAGGSADADDRDPPRQSGDSQLEAVLVGVQLGPFALGFELADPGVDEPAAARARRRWSCRSRWR